MATLEVTQAAVVWRTDDQEPIQPEDEAVLNHLIQRYSRRLALELNDAAITADDVAQDFWLRLLPAIGHYRRRQGPLCRFAARLLKRHRASLIRARYAAKRSVHSVTGQFAGNRRTRATSLACESLTTADAKRHLARDEKDEFATIDQRHDLQVVLSKLKPAQIRLARTLTKLSIAEIARLEGVPRTTLNDRVRVLRKHFEKAELKDYIR